tara:strand:+ start:395 stop:526 length:132 start_codon:yes stop_codon:yes gene_type:complete
MFKFIHFDFMEKKFHKLEGNLISNGAILIWELRQERGMQEPLK